MHDTINDRVLEEQSKGKESEFLEETSERIEQLYFLEKLILNSTRKKRLSLRAIFYGRSNEIFTREYYLLLRQLRDVLNQHLPL